ncbi:MAG: ABC transporter permease [Candidatus Acidiferrales bacterium]
MNRITRLPAIAGRLLAWLSPREWNDSVRGDLEEECARRAMRSGALRACTWAGMQALEIAAQFVLYRTRRRLARRQSDAGAAIAQAGKPVPRKGDSFMQGFLQDLHYGLRMIRKNPGFALLAVLTLALGIGANTAIFTVVNAVLLRPLPYSDPDRLVYIQENNLKKGWDSFSVAPPNFVDWRAQSRSFEKMAAIDSVSFNYTGGKSPERLRGLLATEDFFPLMDVQPQLGRWFTPEEHQPGKNKVVLLTQRGWQRLFHQRDDVLGRMMMLNGEACTVVGVLPEEFRMGFQRDLWAPLVFNADQLASRGSHFLNAMGRLKPGVSVEQAQQELSGIAARLAEQYPDSNRDWGVVVTSMYEIVVGEVRLALLVLMGAVGLVLLIACANVANMLLARASVRAREIAVRAAIGASRGRLVRQLLTESLLLAIIGGGIGLLLAMWGTEALVGSLSGVLPRASEVRVDGWVASFAVLATLLTGLLFGMAPAWMVSRSNLQDTLKEGSAGGSAERRGWLRSTLVVTEVALAVVLVVASGLLLQSFARLQAVPPGFRTDHALTFTAILPRPKYAAPAQQAVFFQQTLERVKALPGVESATLTSTVPVSGNDELYGLTVEGRPTGDGDLPSPLYYLISPDYFRTMEISLLAGRAFTEHDTDGAPPVVVINRAFAERIFPGENPIGQRIRLGRNSSIVREIIGVVADTKHYWLGERNSLLQVYEPFAQMPARGMEFVLRTSVEPTSLAAAVRREVQAVDPDQPITSLQTLEQMLAQSVAQPRFRTLLLGLFGGLALLLASVGVYGVMAYSVARRTQEIGIRMALGAQRGDVLRMVLRGGFALAAVGVLIGLAGAFAATRLLEGLLFGVQPSDLQTYAITAAILVVVALLACAIPALRASRVDPMMALRHE